jgi:hypothetical protein
MKIGEDFNPVEFDLFGFHLIEPNALIGDTFIAFVSFFLAYKTYQISKLYSTNDLNRGFFSYWKIFFIIFGVSFIGGGLGHSFFNIWGVQGKYFGWITSIIAVFFIEQAMLSILKSKYKKIFKKLSLIKLVLAEIALVSVFVIADMDADPQKGLLVPSVSTAIGFITCLGMLGVVYQKTMTRSFMWFWISVLTMVPSAIFQGMKISLYPLFDRNDMSHILLVLALIFYWKGIYGYQKSKALHSLAKAKI